MTKDAAMHDERLAETRPQRGRPQVRPDAQTRDIIYEAARHVFAVKGFASTSMEAIARAAGVSTKTVYRLIDNKAVLFEGMVTSRLDEVIAKIDLEGCADRDLEVALGDALKICGELVLDPEVIALQRMVLSESDAFPQIAETFYNMAMRRTVGTLADWLRRQQQRGTIAVDDFDEAAGMLLGMLIFQPQRAVWFGHRAAPTLHEIEQRARACAKLFLSGCRA
jgi:AcrR family transcriptional regulator